MAEDNGLSGLCFARCAESLLDRLSFYNKQYCDQYKAWVNVSPLAYNEIMRQVNEGLGHLHSLGYCHNGLAPSKIMFDTVESPDAVPEKGTVKIVGFDACQYTSLPIKDLIRPAGWFDSANQHPVSARENEDWSMCRLTRWMLEPHPMNISNKDCPSRAFYTIEEPKRSSEVPVEVFDETEEEILEQLRTVDSSVRSDSTA